MRKTDLLPEFSELVDFWNLHNNNPKNKFICFSYEITQDPLSLFSLYGHATKVFWSSKDKTRQILSFGSLHKIDNQEKLRAQTKLLDKNPDLYLVGNLNFYDDIKSSQVFPAGFHIPYISMVKIEHRSKGIINLDMDQIQNYQDLLSYYKKLEYIFNPQLKTTHHNINLELNNQSPDYDSWDKMVKSSINKIKNKEFDKVVLSRKINLDINSRFSSEEYFLALIQEYQDGENYYFYYQHKDNIFISFSPEKLFSLKDGQVFIDIIAGTIKRGDTEVQDKALADQLLNSTKDLEEHRFVKKDIIERIGQYFSDLSLLQSEKILKLPKVQHLHGIITGKLNQKLAASQLIQILHPTPAVGGSPRGKYESFLMEIEESDRGPYAAPFGILNKGISEIAVGIRSAIITKNQVSLISGCGIVEKSTPEAEWDETFHKIKNFMSVSSSYQQDRLKNTIGFHADGP